MPMARHVDIVRVRIGALRQVVPESLSFCWHSSGIREHADAELENSNASPPR